MKKIVLSGLIILLLLISVGCGWLGDFDFEVGTGYQVWRSSAHQVRIQPTFENHLIWGEEAPIIEAKVVEIAWDNRWVLAKRFPLIDNPQRPDGPQIPDETNPLYYILDTIEVVLYGPFDLASFEEKRQELGISDDLVLRPVRP